MKSVVRFVATFAIVFVAYWAYTMVVVPAIEPPPHPGPIQPTRGLENLQTRDDFARYRHYFAPGAWELNQDRRKEIKTAQGTLLFEEYQPTDDGRITLSPVTLIADPNRGDKDPNGKPDRIIIMQAPEGAELRFDGGLNPLMGKVGQLESGLLKGPITIRSPPQTPEDDDLILQTRDVRIEPSSVSTQQNVSFRFGQSEGQGQNLRIELGESADAQKEDGLGFGELKSLRMGRVFFVSIALPGAGVLPATSIETPLQPAHGSALLPPTTGRPTDATPVRITCAGEFYFDFRAWVATFNNNVVVSRPTPIGKDDRLTGDQLAVYFNSPEEKKNRPPPPANATAAPDVSNNVNKIVMTGKTVNLVAPSVDAYGHGTKLEFHVASRLIDLSAPQNVTLRHGTQVIVAPKIEYVLAEDAKRIGNLWAPGPGHMVGRDGSEESRPIRVDWRDDVTLGRQGNHHVLSVNGGVDVVVEGLGELHGGNAKVWLAEVPRVQTLPVNGVPPKTQPKFSVRPDRVVIENNVTFDSTKLKGRTNRIDCTLAYRSQPLPAFNQRGAGAPVQPTAKPTPLFSFDKAATKPGTVESKYDIVGDVVSATIVITDEGKEVESLSVEGNARFAELPPVPGDDPPLFIEGHTFRLTDGQSADPKMRIVGQYAAQRRDGSVVPERRAIVIAEGVRMTGLVLRVHQGANRMWVDGPGDLQTKRGVDLPGGQTAKDETLHVSWTGGLDFDGLSAIISQGVQARGQQRLKDGQLVDFIARGEQLDVSLTRRINFAKPKDEQDVAARLLAFRDQATIENRSYDLTGAQQSYEKMQVRNLTLDQPSGRLHGDGPGWMRTVRYGGKQTSGARALPTLQRGHKSKLMHVSVEFDDEVIGRVKEKEATFLNNVRVIYGPATKWDDKIMPDAIFDRPGYGVVMTCRQLTLVDLGRNDESAMEMDATGNVRVDGRADLGFFVAQAPRIKYSEINDRLILEGNAQSKARVETWEQRGDEPQVWQARSIQYWPKTKNLRMPDFQSGEIFNVGPKKKSTPPPKDNVDPRGNDGLFNPTRS